MIRISIQDDAGEPAATKRLAERVLRTSLSALRLKDAEVSVLLSGERRLRELNRRHRRVNRPTDVLSFPQEEAGPFLGDIAISVPTAKKQAAARGIPFEQELALLCVHGLLHLLGHDHAKEKEKKRMFGLQARCLKRVFRLD